MPPYLQLGSLLGVLRILFGSNIQELLKDPIFSNSMIGPDYHDMKLGQGKWRSPFAPTIQDAFRSPSGDFGSPDSYFRSLNRIPKGYNPSPNTPDLTGLPSSGIGGRTDLRLTEPPLDLPNPLHTKGQGYQSQDRLVDYTLDEWPGSSIQPQEALYNQSIQTPTRGGPSFFLRTGSGFQRNPATMLGHPSDVVYPDNFGFPQKPEVPR
jgi:hypothetical protein